MTAANYRRGDRPAHSLRKVTEQRLEQLRILVRLLFAAAALVLVFSVIGAIQIASSDDAVPLFETFQRQSRGIGALAALGGGVVGAGVLAGLGGILTALIEREESR
jgi:hypothetical protein